MWMINNAQSMRHVLNRLLKITALSLSCLVLCVGCGQKQHSSDQPTDKPQQVMLQTAQSNITLLLGHTVTLSLYTATPLQHSTQFTINDSYSTPFSADCSIPAGGTQCNMQISATATQTDLLGQHNLQIISNNPKTVLLQPVPITINVINTSNPYIEVPSAQLQLDAPSGLGAIQTSVQLSGDNLTTEPVTVTAMVADGGSGIIKLDSSDCSALTTEQATCQLQVTAQDAGDTQINLTASTASGHAVNLSNNSIRVHVNGRKPPPGANAPQFTVNGPGDTEKNTALIINSGVAGTPHWNVFAAGAWSSDTVFYACQDPSDARSVVVQTNAQGCAAPSSAVEVTAYSIAPDSGVQQVAQGLDATLGDSPAWQVNLEASSATNIQASKTNPTQVTLAKVSNDVTQHFSFQSGDQNTYKLQFQYKLSAQTMSGGAPVKLWQTASAPAQAAATPTALTLSYPSSMQSDSGLGKLLNLQATDFKAADSSQTLKFSADQLQLNTAAKPQAITVSASAAPTDKAYVKAAYWDMRTYSTTIDSTNAPGAVAVQVTAQDLIKSGYNIVIVTFLTNQNTGKIHLITGLSDGDPVIASNIQALQQAGIKVLVSLGGANMQTPPTAADVASDIKPIINQYKFDGIDLDLEGSAIKTMADPSGFAQALIKLKSEESTTLSKPFLITAAPEWIYLTPVAVPGAPGTFVNEWAQSVNTAGGGNLVKLLEGLSAAACQVGVSCDYKYLDYMWPQTYNQGAANKVIALNRDPAGNDDMEKLLAALDITLTTQAGYSINNAHIVSNNVGRGGLTPIPASKLALSLEAAPGAGSYANEIPTSTQLSAAVDDIQQNKSQIAGFMTWSANWDNTSKTTGTYHHRPWDMEQAMAAACKGGACVPTLDKK